MKELKYCPKCGKDQLIWDEIKKWSCINCNYSYYHNCASAVAVVLKYQNQILFTRRNQNPKWGKLDLPGGFVDANESAEDACKRELIEELGWALDCKKLRYKASFPNDYLYNEISYQTLDLFFEYETHEKPQFEINPVELQYTEWISLENLDLNEMAFVSQRRFMTHFFLKK